MKHLHFEPEADGFYGAYWESKTPSDTAMIAMLGDDPEDYMGKTCVKWLHTYGINVMSMSPGKKNYSHHNYPIERIGYRMAQIPRQQENRHCRCLHNSNGRTCRRLILS